MLNNTQIVFMIILCVCINYTTISIAGASTVISSARSLFIHCIRYTGPDTCMRVHAISRMHGRTYLVYGLADRSGASIRDSRDIAKLVS